MATYEDHQEAIASAAAALAEVERQRPSKHLVLSGDCKEDIRLGDEWLASANERAAIRAAWEDNRDVHVAAHRKARAASLRWWRRMVEEALAEYEGWWNALVEEALAEDEQRSGTSRHDDAAA
jgi:hypothetical protein